MEEFRNLLAARCGYPRHGAIIEASRATGVAQSLLSQYVAGSLQPKPAQLRRLAAYLDRPYNELLTMVYGDDPDPHRREPLTPHDQALRAVDVIAAAMAELRSSLLAMTSESHPRNGPQGLPSLDRDKIHEGEQERRVGPLKFPWPGERRRALAGA